MTKTIYFFVFLNTKHLKCVKVTQFNTFPVRAAFLMTIKNYLGKVDLKYKIVFIFIFHTTFILQQF